MCCSPPCTDEPRIKLEVGDVVNVTRWKRYELIEGQELYVNNLKYEFTGIGCLERGLIKRKMVRSIRTTIE